MENDNMNQQTDMSPEPGAAEPLAPRSEKKSSGALVGIIVIIIILILGAYYFWSQLDISDDLLPTPAVVPDNQESVDDTEVTATTETKSDFDADTGTANFDDLDQDLSDPEMDSSPLVDDVEF